MTARVITGQLLAALAVAVLGISAPASADVGTGQMAACAERGNPLDCVPTMRSTASGDTATLTRSCGMPTGVST